MSFGMKAIIGGALFAAVAAIIGVTAAVFSSGGGCESQPVTEVIDKMKRDDLRLSAVVPVLVKNNYSMVFGENLSAPSFVCKGGIFSSGKTIALKSEMGVIKEAKVDGELLR